MRSLYVALGLLVLYGFGNAYAQPTTGASAVKVTQFLFPHDFMKLSAESRGWYVGAVLDYEREASPQGFDAIRGCVDSHSLDQLTAIVEKALASGDTRVGPTMPLVVHNAILLNCPKS